MDKEELLNKIEYMEFTRLLKVKNEITYQNQMIENEQNLLKKTSHAGNKAGLSESVSKRQKNIEELLDLVFFKDPTVNMAQKIAMLDYRVHRDLPFVLENLRCGKYHYNWNMKDCEFNYSMIKKEPRIRDVYRNHFELKSLEESDEFDKEYPFSDVLNPIYFDIQRLAFLDSKYLPFLTEVIQHRLYDPNHLDCVPSYEPFYGIIDKFGILDLTSSVLLDSRTNFNLLVNSSDLLGHMIFYTGKRYRDEGVLDPKFSLISSILREKEVSILDTTRFNGSLGEGRDDFYDAYVSTLVSSYKNCDSAEVQDLLTYLASDSGIQKQVMISKYPSYCRDMEIDNYCNFIQDRRGSNVEGIAKLKNLKLY